MLGVGGLLDIVDQLAGVGLVLVLTTAPGPWGGEERLGE
jgi:hypothetical protein